MPSLCLAAMHIVECEPEPGWPWEEAGVHQSLPRDTQVGRGKQAAHASQSLQTVPGAVGSQAGPAMATGAAWLLGGPWPRRRVPRAVWAAALRERGAGRLGVRGKDAWALLTLEYVSG